MSWGKIYETTWWGNPTTTWGNVYYDLAVTDPVQSLLSTLQGRSTYYENATCTETILNEYKDIE